MICRFGFKSINFFVRMRTCSFTFELKWFGEYLKSALKSPLSRWHISWLRGIENHIRMAESMDKKLVKKRFTVKKVATYLGSAALVFFIAWQFIFADRRSTLKTERDKITISEVKMGEFKEYIPQTGTVEPARSVYLDAIEGGNIKRIYRES